ncbi:MAG: class I tRNA ligase family protein, partial [Chloroflexota bacterium]|nr:class I tRNA ligase family protein [Chloroflexota bacterium]
VLPPAVFPRASGEIAEMIAFVERLLQRGHAYVVDGHVYFSVATDPEYGELSKLDRDAMIALAGERGGDPDDPRRRDPLDFVLWRPSKSGEPRMSSPWGEGLPGWHLECSTMALKYLGAPIDIHGGGADLIFPHHENEIAQSEGVGSGRPFACFWLHTGMVFLGGQKMSKSLGNMVFVRDLLPRYGADALRLYLSGCQYRDELHYEEARLIEAAALAGRLTAAVALPLDGSPTTLDLAPFREKFTAHMDDDLDTPRAISVLVDLAEAIRIEQMGGRETRDGQALLRELGDVLGLRLEQGNTQHTPA